MTDAQRRAAAKEFSAQWAGKGYEKGQSQAFWLSLLRDVYGVEHPETFITFEDQVALDHTSFIDGFKEYTSIVGIFGENMGPPDDAGRLNTMVGFIYDSLSTNSQGRASAAALILFAIILVVTLVNLRISKKRVHY